MTELKLARLPDRIPVKIAITVSPELNRALHAYAELYRAAYGESESVAELIPFMLEGFLDNDRGFAKARREKGLDGATAAASTASLPLRRRGRNATDSPVSTHTEK